MSRCSFNPLSIKRGKDRDRDLAQAGHRAIAIHSPSKKSEEERADLAGRLLGQALQSTLHGVKEGEAMVLQLLQEHVAIHSPLGIKESTRPRCHHRQRRVTIHYPSAMKESLTGGPLFHCAAVL